MGYSIYMEVNTDSEYRDGHNEFIVNYKNMEWAYSRRQGQEFIEKFISDNIGLVPMRYFIRGLYNSNASDVKGYATILDDDGIEQNYQYRVYHYRVHHDVYRIEHNCSVNSDYITKTYVIEVYEDDDDDNE